MFGVVPAPWLPPPPRLRRVRCLDCRSGNPDNWGMTMSNEQPERHVVDYAMDDFVRADTPEQLRALGNVTREEILALLSERAATTTQLARAMGKPKGSVGYHVKVLEKAGFVRVVRTNKVRAMTEKYYGRTARTIVFGRVAYDDPLFVLDSVRREAVIEAAAPLPMFTLRHARISEEQAVAFTERLLSLSTEFLDLPREGDRAFGLIAGIYPTSGAALGDDRDS